MTMFFILWLFLIIFVDIILLMYTNLLSYDDNKITFKQIIKNLIVILIKDSYIYCACYIVYIVDTKLLYF